MPFTSLPCSEGGQRLLSVHQEASSLGIEASAASPPRLPMVGASERGPLLKGQGPSSSSRGSLQPAASPPMPPPFFPAATRRHKRRSSDASRHSGSASSASSPGGGGSPKAAGSGKGEVEGQGGLPLVEDEDICPTCLDPYTGRWPHLCVHLLAWHAWQIGSNRPPPQRPATHGRPASCLAGKPHTWVAWPAPLVSSSCTSRSSLSPCCLLRPFS